MSTKLVGSFSPALKPHAEWVDQNVGNKDGRLTAAELEAYKKKHPDATQYDPLKKELGTQKPVQDFSPASQPHAQWIDQNVGNKDGHLSADELDSYKAKYPDAASYAGLKAEMPLPGTTAGPGGGVPVGAGGGVLGFLLRNKSAVGPAAPGTPTVATTSPTAGVKTSLPLDALTQVGASPAGDTFHLDAASVATMSVRVRQVVLPNQGPGTEVAFRLTPEESSRLATAFNSNQVAGASQQPFVLEKGEFKDGATVFSGDEPYQPKVGYSNALKAWRVEEAGKYTVEFVPSRENPQVYRDRVRIRVLGATDQERKANLEAALARIQAPGTVADANATQSDRLLRLSLLRMVDPVQAEELGRSIKDVSVAALDEVLKAHGFQPEDVKGIAMKEVFPGQMTPVAPVLGEAYAKLGVKAVMAGIREVDFAVKILTSDGLMSSLERYGRGLHKAGASLSSDEMSGGAEYAFTRLVTPKAISAGTNISSSYGYGQVQLLSAGDEMKKLLSRTDWHAYPNDSYGVTVSRSQAEAPDADTVAKSEYTKRTSKFTTRPVLDDLVAQVNGDKPAPNSYGSANNFAAGNEACFKGGVAASAWTHAVVPSQQVKDQFITSLKAAGVTHLGGKPVEEAVIIATTWKQVGDQIGLGE
jgi:hypothetical protein